MAVVDRLGRPLRDDPFRGNCRVVAVANLTLSGLQTIDDVVLVAGDRVLVTAQTTTAANGIYIASSTTWARSRDLSVADDFNGPIYVAVEEGTSYRNTTWRFLPTGAIVVGATAITFSQGAVGVASVTNAMLADMAQATFKMRADGDGTGVPINGTAEQARTALKVFAINFAWFEPDSTGATDCTTALQSAFTYLQSRGGGTLFVPQGTYKITDYITVAGFGIRIAMESRTTKFLLSKTNSFLFVFTGDYDFFELEGGQVIQDAATTPTNGSPIEIQGTGPYGCLVNNMVFYGTFGGVATTLTSGSVNQLVVRDTSMLQMLNRGVYLANAVDFTLDNVTVEIDDYANGKYPLHIDSSCDGGHVSDFKATKGQYGVYCSNLLGGGVSPRHINFDWVRADGNDDVCWKIDALYRSHMNACWAASVRTGAKGAVFSGSGVKSVAWRGGQFLNIDTNCVDITGAADNVSISGALFAGWGLAGANDAIAIDANANKSFSITDNTFADDSDFSGTERSGVAVGAGTYRSYRITNNTGVGLSAATVVDSGSASVAKQIANNI